jgi:hypothetical protein
MIIAMAAEKTASVGALRQRAPRETRRSAAPAEAAVPTIHPEKGFLPGATAATETTISAVAYATTTAASEPTKSALRIAGANKPTQLVWVAPGTATSTAGAGRIVPTVGSRQAFSCASITASREAR